MKTDKAKTKTTILPRVLSTNDAKELGRLILKRM
jgi:hypothetical protein